MPASPAGAGAAAGAGSASILEKPSMLLAPAGGSPQPAKAGEEVADGPVCRRRRKGEVMPEGEEEVCFVCSS